LRENRSGCPLQWQKDFLIIAQALCAKEKRVLKIDVWNELYGLPIVGNIVGHTYQIEIDEKRVRQAIATGLVNIMWGDCRRMPYPENIFDVVLDFLTIGRGFKEYQVVLFEYARVLKVGGMLGIVYWTANKEIEQCNKFGGTKQMYFCRAEFESELQRYFKTYRLWDFDISEKNPKFIIRAFIGRKK